MGKIRMSYNFVKNDNMGFMTCPGSSSINESLSWKLNFYGNQASYMIIFDRSLISQLNFVFILDIYRVRN